VTDSPRPGSRHQPKDSDVSDVDPAQVDPADLDTADIEDAADDDEWLHAEDIGNNSPFDDPADDLDGEIEGELDGSVDEREMAEHLGGDDALVLREGEADSEAASRGLFSRLGSGMASTGKFIWDIPGNLGINRSNSPQLRREPADAPLGARQVSHGYADDLWQARPPLHRPYPVILIHGTISSKNVWQNLVLRLRADDFVVFCPDYGVHGTQDIPTSAADVGAYIEQVIAATGAPQVDIVGHSQGGLLARYWINEMEGEDYVHHLITLGAPHHGTSLLGMLGGLLTSETTQRMATAMVRRIFGPAGMQQVMGSALLETLAASPDTRPDIIYTCFATLNDSTVVPPDQAFLEGEGTRSDGSPRVKNAYLQDSGIQRCRHEELPSNPHVQALVQETLLDGLEHDLDWTEDS